MFKKISDNRLLIIVFVIFIGFVGLALMPKSDNSNTVSMQMITSDISNGGQLIDVRTAEEYADGHIEGSINLSLQDIQAKKFPLSSKDKRLYLYCRSGNRSGQAAKLLQSAGYKTVVDLGAMTYIQSIGGIIKKT